MVIICDDLAALSREAAAHFAHSAEEATAARGRFTVALSGGTTPRALYALLAQDSWRARVPWAATHVFWGDERCVPPDHPDSNYRLAYRTLLAHVPIPAGNIHRLRGEIDPTVAASEYEDILRAAFDLRPGQLPRFDLILLGLGEDGHTASLFPGIAAVHERERLVVAQWVEKLNAYRLTLTPPVLNAAAAVLFLVAGGAKAAALRQVLSGDDRPDRYPAQVVRPAAGDVTWLVDRAAAGQLSS